MTATGAALFADIASISNKCPGLEPTA